MILINEWSKDDYTRVNKAFNEQLKALQNAVTAIDNLSTDKLLTGKLVYSATDVMFEVTERLIDLILQGHTLEIVTFQNKTYTYANKSLYSHNEKLSIMTVLAKYKAIKAIHIGKGLPYITQLKNWCKYNL